jgi:acetyltransferase-like isoleucine patch superfamily enzyme
MQGEFMLKTVDITPEVALALQQRGIRISSGQTVIHTGAVIEPPFRAEYYFGTHHPLKAGAFSYFNSSFSYFLTEIGRYCSVAGGVQMGAPEHPMDWVTTSSCAYDRNIWADFEIDRRFQGPVFKEKDIKPHTVIIEHDVWIGGDAYIKAGVKLGTGCVIGNSAVVTKDVPPYAIVVGNPGRIVKYRFPDEIISDLLESAWWEYAFTDFSGLPMNNPKAFLWALNNTELPKYRPELLTLDQHLEEIAVELLQKEPVALLAANRR